MTKSHQDLETKKKTLEVELEKVKISEMSTQTVTEIIEPSNVKQEECETNIEEKHIAIPCKYFHTNIWMDVGKELSAGSPMMNMIEQRRKVEKSSKTKKNSKMNKI